MPASIAHLPVDLKLGIPRHILNLLVLKSVHRAAIVNCHVLLWVPVRLRLLRVHRFESGLLTLVLVALKCGRRLPHLVVLLAPIRSHIRLIDAQRRGDELSLPLLGVLAGLCARLLLHNRVLFVDLQVCVQLRMVARWVQLALRVRGLVLIGRHLRVRLVDAKMGLRLVVLFDWGPCVGGNVRVHVATAHVLEGRFV